MLKTVDAILDGNVKTVPQESVPLSGKLHPAPKIFKETCRIDWTQGTKRIYDFIRGLSPYPGAWTEFHVGETVSTLKLFETQKIFADHALEPGAFVTDGKSYLHIATSDGYLNVLSLQLAGKKRMGIADFMKGYRHSADAFVR